MVFIGEDLTLAHVTRPLVLAKALDLTRYDVHFATGGKYQRFVEGSELNSHTIPTLSSEIFIERLAKGRPIVTVKEIEISVQTDLALFRQLSPDMVVGDFRLSLSISTQIAKINYACLTNAYWSPYSTLPFPVPELPIVDIFGVKLVGYLSRLLLPFIMRYHATPINAVRKKYGLSTYRSIKEVYTAGNWALYLDTPSLAPTFAKPDHHLYLGPLLWSPDVPLPAWWHNLPDNKPVVYVTMGSSGDIGVVKTVIAVLKEMNVTAIVSSAGRFDAEDSHDNLFVENFIPGIKAAQKASMVICSGGTATSYQALSCGTPVLGTPCNADQYLSMEAVVRQGAGVLVRAGKVTSRNIKQGIETILSNKDFAFNANRIKTEMDEYHAPTRFSDFINAVTR